MQDSKGALSILDGQHRVGMMSILQEKQRKKTKNSDGDDVTLDLDRVLVEVYPYNSEFFQGDTEDADSHREAEERHAKDIFEEVNKAEPIKLVDMPGVAKGSERKALNDASERLAEKFPDMFSPSQRCRSPHLNVDNLRDAIFASEIMKRHNLKTARALEAWMMEQNAALAKKYESEGGDDDDGAQYKVPAAALKKARKFGFYLGLDSSWLYN